MTLSLTKSLPGRQGTAFFASRLINGVLALIHVTLAVRALGPSQSGSYFVAFTAAWLLSTVLKFGVDGILPRTVAESEAASSAVPSSRGQLALGAALLVVALPLTVVGLHVPDTVPMVGSVLGIAIAWAVTLICAGLLKAKGRIALSGLVANVIWPLGLVMAALLVLPGGSTPSTLALATLGFGLGAVLIAVAITVHALGLRYVSAVVDGCARGSVEPDAYGAALLSVLYEVIVWLPVVLAALLGASPTATAAIFAATRVAGVFSWGYQAVVAVLTPRIAMALASGDVTRTRLLLWRGGLAGAILTVPPCIVGAVFAQDILHVFDARYTAFSSILVVLLLARTVDAIAGPVGEALLVGRRTWLDSAIVGFGIAVGVAVSFGAHGAMGDVAAGVGGATAFIVINLARIAVVGRLLTRGWRSRLALRLPRFHDPGIWRRVAALLGAFVAAAALWNVRGGVGWVWLGAAGGALAAVALVGLAVRCHGWRKVLQSPVLIVGLVLVTEFGLRPASLALDPQAASDGLRAIGFSWVDLTHATVLGVAGLVAFCATFAAISGRPVEQAQQPISDPPSARRLTAGLGVALLLGCLLWIALFLRLGGPSALVDDPATLHLDQFGGAYGVFGMLLCFAVALAALWNWCRRPTRGHLLLSLLGFGAGALASVCLATRGPLIASALAGFALVLRHRRLRLRATLAVGAVAILLVSALMVLRTVRGYTQVVSLQTAITEAEHTSPLTTLTGDLVEFDHLVVVEKVVPSVLPWLDGGSFADVPGAFLPRALWPSKPLPIDFKLSREVYGPGTKAGTPFTLPGEAYWNFGLWGGLAAMCVLGGAGGLMWRWLQRQGSILPGLAASLVYGYTYLVLTRPLAAMVMTTALAVAAAGAACLLGGLWQPLHRSRFGLVDLVRRSRWRTRPARAAIRG